MRKSDPIRICHSNPLTDTGCQGKFGIEKVLLHTEQFSKAQKRLDEIGLVRWPF